MGGILITGGSRGIGAATALLASAHGHDVAISYRVDADAAQQVVTACREQGRNAAAFRADVAVEADVVALFDDAVGALEGLDGVVINAGMLAQQARLEAMDAARLQRVVDVNVVGALLTAREAVRHLSTGRGGKGGVIVNVSSAASRLGSPNEYIDYAVTKGAVDTLTIGLAQEVGPEGIRVVGIRPGLIETEIHADGGEPDRVQRLAPAIPLRRGGTAEEVAEVIVWAMSPGAAYVSGTSIDVAGGR